MEPANVRSPQLPQTRHAGRDSRRRGNLTGTRAGAGPDGAQCGTASRKPRRGIAEAEGVGANTLLLNFNRGAMPHALFMEQLRRFGAEVLPVLQAHQITQVPV